MFVKIVVNGAEHVYECDAYHIRNVSGSEEGHPIQADEIAITMERSGLPDVHWQSTKDGVSVYVTNNEGRTIDHWMWENGSQTAKVSI
jgi:hypothetical protein